MSGESKFHAIRDGRFVCTAPDDAPCRNYPDCGCEVWDPDLHGEVPAPGHEAVPQPQCWRDPWINDVGLHDSYDLDAAPVSDDEWPNGPVETEWHGDYLTWRYADELPVAVTP